MAEETQYTANTGMVTISTGNDNLDGTGTLGSVLSGSLNGTFVKSVIIKAQGNTTEGMIRLFVKGAGTTRIIGEIDVPAITKSSRNCAFGIEVPLDLKLQSGFELMASTQKAEVFNIIGFGLNWEYYSSSVRTDTTQYTALSAMSAISTANPNLDGTGSMSTVVTAGVAASGWKGCKINSVTVKATVNTTPGMIRLFIKDTSTNIKLFLEVPVGYVNKSSSALSFEETVYFPELYLSPGYSLLASTEVAESFIVSADALNWNYLP